MTQIMDFLREFTFASVAARLFLAMAAGGAIGWGRSRRRKAAGLRTFMLVSVGAALAVILSAYEYEMLGTIWADAVAAVGMKFDASRFAAQAVGGIGFLAAGTIIKTSDQLVEGLTTATGLFAATCLGMAAGAGYLELVIPATAIIIFTLTVLHPAELEFRRRTRIISVFVTYEKGRDISVIMQAVNDHGAQIIEVQTDKRGKKHTAVIGIRLSKERTSHSQMLSTIATLPCVSSVEEMVP